MAKTTLIPWADATFNPVWGCAKVGPGCDHCYAENQSNRFGKWWGVGVERREFGDKHWNGPVRWNKAAKKAGTRPRVFCASMADVFDKDWPDGTRERLWALIKATPHLDWLLLTKRIGNVKKMLPDDWGDGYANVWLGITVVNQDEYCRDEPKLKDTPAAIRWLSIEPQLSTIILENNSAIDWVVCGAESGHKRRPFTLKWARMLRNQCMADGISFFFKQIIDAKGRKVETPELDGQRWTEFPTPTEGPK